MSRVHFRVAILISILPLVAACALIEAPSVTQIRSALPPGSSLGRVDSYLTQYQVEHSYFQRSNQMTAVVHNVRNNGMVQQDLSLIFHFDQNERLAGIEVKPAYTAP